jgi:hypothetical protein
MQLIYVEDSSEEGFAGLKSAALTGRSCSLVVGSEVTCIRLWKSTEGSSCYEIRKLHSRNEHGLGRAPQGVRAPRAGGRVPASPTTGAGGSTIFPSRYIPTMCGRYRLSRRKQIIEEHFDSVSGRKAGPHATT